MIKCASCGHENVPGTQFCEGCGEELPAANATTDTAAAAPSAAGDMIQCPACDNMNPADNIACEVCGAELRPGAATTPLADTSLADASLADSPMTDAPVSPSAPMIDPLATATADASAVAPATPIPPADLSMPDPSLAPPTAVTPPGVTPSAVTPSGIPDVATIAPDPIVAPAAGGDLAPGKVKLVVEQGQTVGAQFVLGDAEMLVGREDTDEDIYPDIDLSDQDAGYVHRRHATLRFENGGLTVTHLGGGNKTRVNNRPIPDDEPQPVKLGDKIAFGKVVMRVLPA